MIQKNKCVVTEYGGPVKGQIDTNISINFSVFGWLTDEASTTAGDPMITGVVANSGVKSYAGTSVSPDFRTFVRGVLAV